MLDFFADHWKVIAALAGSTLAFVTVIGLTLLAPVTIPTVAALFAAGFASGGAFYLLSKLLDRERMTVGGLLVSALTSGIFSVATGGLGKLVTPLISKAVDPIAENVVPDPLDLGAKHVFRTAATNALAGAVFGASKAVVKNAIADRPLDRGLADATAYGVISGLLVGPAKRVVSAAGLPVVESPPAEEPPPSEGFVRALGKAEAPK
jgi:hypothetical protein